MAIRKGEANSREEMIKALANSMRPEPKVDKAAIRDINALWIPVSLRTPSEDECKRCQGLFLTSRSDGVVQIDKFFYDKSGYGAKGFYVRDNTEVEAWMNLPDVYEKPEEM